MGIFSAVGWICWSRNRKLFNKGSDFHICVGIFWQPFQEMSALPGLCLGRSGHLKAFSRADDQRLLPTTLPLTAGLLLELQRFPSPHRETLPTWTNKAESCYIKQRELSSNCVFSFWGGKWQIVQEGASSGKTASHHCTSTKLGSEGTDVGGWVFPVSQSSGSCLVKGSGGGRRLRWQRRKTWSSPPAINTSKKHVHVQQSSRKTNRRLAKKCIYNQGCKERSMPSRVGGGEKQSSWDSSS